MEDFIISSMYMQPVQKQEFFFIFSQNFTFYLSPSIATCLLGCPSLHLLTCSSASVLPPPFMRHLIHVVLGIAVMHDTFI